MRSTIDSFAKRIANGEAAVVPSGRWVDTKHKDGTTKDHKILHCGGVVSVLGKNEDVVLVQYTEPDNGFVGQTSCLSGEKFLLPLGEYQEMTENYYAIKAKEEREAALFREIAGAE